MALLATVVTSGPEVDADGTANAIVTLADAALNCLGALCANNIAIRDEVVSSKLGADLTARLIALMKHSNTLVRTRAVVVCATLLQQQQQATEASRQPESVTVSQPGTQHCLFECPGMA